VCQGGQEITSVSTGVVGTGVSLWAEGGWVFSVGEVEATQPGQGAEALRDRPWAGRTLGMGL